MKLSFQYDITDCGAACLAMIAQVNGKKISIGRIRAFAGTDREGTNLAGMVKAGEALGFSAKAMKGDAASLDDDLPLPFIAHIKKIDDGKTILHYVVVAKIGKKRILVFDPAEGKRRWSREEFLSQWSGYVVFLSPRSDFKAGDETKGLFERFLPILKPHWKTLAQVIVASAILILFGILSSLYFRYLIDDVLVARAEFSLHALSIGIVLLTLFQTLLAAMRGQLLLLFSTKADLSLIFGYFRHVLGLPMAFFDSRKTGEILSRLEDAQKIRAALSEASISVLMDLVMVIVVGFVLFFQSSTLFIVAIATVPLSTGIVWAFSKPFARRYRRLRGEAADVQSGLVEAVGGIAAIKAMNAQTQAFEDFEKRQMKAIWTGYRLGIFRNVQGILVGLVEGWGSNVLFWVGSWFILKGSLSLGQLISFNALLGYFIGPLQRLVTLQPSLQEAFVAADRLGEILDLPEEIDEGRTLLKPVSFRGEIELRDLVFRYGTRRPVLQGLSLHIEAGQSVALVGPSGCGKTSLAKLILKFYEAEEGEILLDGDNLKDIDTLHLRSRVGYVPQETFLFSGTIRENIALHSDEAPFEEIVEAAKKAGAHDFIVELPQRYDTVLAERGASLSGGERQRIALARALLGKPEILVLDEATSNLDTISERRIEETLASLNGEGMTILVIAHRLSTVVRRDRIFLMEAGRVVESGRHVELLAREGAYSSLWRSANA